MRKVNLFYNQRRTFKFCSKSIHKFETNFSDKNLKVLNEIINSPEFSTEKFNSQLLEFNDEYKYYLNPSYKEKFPNAYENFVKNRINNNDNVMDLFPLMFSDDVDTFTKIYKKTNGKSEFLDDMIIKISMNNNDVDFIMKINYQKDNFLGLSRIFTINKPDTYYEKFNNISIDNDFQKYEQIKWNPSDYFFNNVLKNIDNEKSKLILSKYNIKLNKNYNKLVLENMIKNKNEELIKLYINNPSFSFKKCSKEQFIHFFPFIFVFIYIMMALFLINYGNKNRTVTGDTSLTLGCAMISIVIIGPLMLPI